MTTTLVDRSRGLMLGLALGNAMGRSIELASWKEIQERYGLQGRLEPEGPLVASEDTAISVVVAEALVDAAGEGPDALMSAVTRRLIDWGNAAREQEASDMTCFEAAGRLRTGMSWMESGVSWSKGSGAPMRAAPVGLVFASFPLLLREVSIMVARTTHGHPTAHAACVTVAVGVREALRDADPREWSAAAVRAMSGMARTEMVDALERMMEAMPAERDQQAMEQLGQGWVAEEAVAMALCALLRHPVSFEDTVRCAINHGGDSDTVGGIAGALAGARCGAEALPSAWLDHLEARDELVDLADRLAAARETLR